MKDSRKAALQFIVSIERSHLDFIVPFERMGKVLASHSDSPWSGPHDSLFWSIAGRSHHLGTSSMVPTVSQGLYLFCLVCNLPGSSMREVLLPHFKDKRI